MERLDILLCQLGIYNSREKAKQAIQMGRVSVDGKLVLKPSTMCNSDANIVGLPFEFVGRGGFKLQKAIEEFNIDLNNKVCLDIGASTGGFTDVCLKNGAKKVYAVDVGQGQLDAILLKDKRVVNMQKTNYLQLPKAKIKDVDFVCIDVSFVSLTHLAQKLTEDNFKQIVALIKPQFECGPEYAKKHKGVVKDEKVRQKAIKNVISCFKNLNYDNLGLITSPITGGDGNIEYLVYLVKV